MFYRQLDDKQYTSFDLTDNFNGYPVFIVAGSPAISDLPLSLLETSRLPTLALNNVPYVYPNPTMWLTADKPCCFGGHFYARPDIIKFAPISYRDDIVEATGKPMKHHPLMLFYTTYPGFDLEAQFFDPGHAFAWWKSVFPISLQLAWRLGARRVYLVGCSFASRLNKTYAWDVQLTKKQAIYSQQTYDQDLERLKKLQPVFKDNGFIVISCTPGSRANGILPLVDLNKAIDGELRRLPPETHLSHLKHSSETATQTEA